jgi:hypothetical protein
MAESALGAWTWLVAWAAVRWRRAGTAPWGGLAAVGAAAALFTRADGVLLAAALAIVLIIWRAPGWRRALVLLGLGGFATALHYALVTPIYMGTTYGAFTFARAIGGVVALLGAGVLGLAIFALGRARPGWTRETRVLGALRAARRITISLLAGLALSATLVGVAPGIGRDASMGAASPLAWLPGYVPWPVLVLAATGLVAYGWTGVPGAMVPVLLVGGLPALFYLPDPLVTGDHPWMVRRLIPAVIPLLAIMASIGARALWQLHPASLPARLTSSGRAVAAILVGVGFALALAADRDLLAGPHATGAITAMGQLADGLPDRAIVIFPAGQAGIHQAMALDWIFGADAFAITEAVPSRDTIATLARLSAAGRELYLAWEGVAPPPLPTDVTATAIRQVRLSYLSADHGVVPPPLQLTAVEDRVTLYRLQFPAIPAPRP